MFNALHTTSHSPFAASAALKSALHHYTAGLEGKSQSTAPSAFITMSREPGAGAITLSHLLAKTLKQSSGKDWSAWDRELIDRVAHEHHIDHATLERMENRSFSWLEDLLSGMSQQATREQLYVYRRTMMTIRAIAEAGNAIIVGMGGAFVTAGIPGGLHVRLVAPREHRVKWMGAKLNVDLKEAARYVAEREKAQAEFFRRFWSTKTLTPELFTITLNSARLSIQEMVDCLIPLIRAREQAAIEQTSIATSRG